MKVEPAERYLTAIARYQRDPLFHALVTHLVVQIEQLNLTPTEIREAAMLAAVLFEERKPERWIEAFKQVRIPEEER